MKKEEKNGYDPSKTFLTTKTVSLLHKAGYSGEPTHQAAADWLRMDHGIYVSAEHVEENLSWKNHVVKPGIFDETGNWYEDECRAFECGIRKAVKFIGITNHKNNKNSMKPFNLEAAKAGKPVCTRDGQKARILCFDLKDKHFKIAAAISLNENTEYIETFTIDGRKYRNASYEDDSDLMMVSEKKQGWINVYKETEGEYYTDKVIFKTECSAFRAVSPDGYVTTMKIDWEE